MKKLILLYNFSGERLSGVKLSAVSVKALTKEIAKADYGKRLGSLAELKGYENAESGELTDFDDELLMMCGFGSEDIDMLLKSLRKHGVGRVALKAIITDTNKDWTSGELYRAVKEDHEEMLRRRQQQ